MKPKYLLILATVIALPVSAAAQESRSGIVLPALDLTEVAPAELRGADVLGMDGQEIGQITAVVFTSTGEMEAAVVSTGGFLGFGRHSVSIPLDELQISAPTDAPGAVVVQLPMTEAQLKDLPEVGAAPEAQ